MRIKVWLIKSSEVPVISLIYQAFKGFVESLISKRKYDAKVFVDVKTSTKTALTTQKREKHSQKVRALLEDKAEN